MLKEMRKKFLSLVFFHLSVFKEIRFFINLSAFNTSHTDFYTNTDKERDLIETWERERERGGGEKKSSRKKKNSPLFYFACDFLIESERILRRFRREGQKSLTHSFIHSFDAAGIYRPQNETSYASGEEENESPIVVVQQRDDDDGESGGRENSLALGDAKEIRLRWSRWK